jgi:hypothetical protein
MTLQKIEDDYKASVKKLWLNWEGGETDIDDLPSCWKTWNKDMENIFQLGVEYGRLLVDKESRGHFNDRKIDLNKLKVDIGYDE